MKTSLILFFFCYILSVSALPIYNSSSPKVDSPYVSNPIPDVLIFEDFGFFNAVQNVHSHFTDPNNDPLEYYIESVTLHAITNGCILDTISFETIPNKFGKDTVIVVAYNLNGTAKDTFTVTVVSVNDIPVFMNLPGFYYFRSDSVLSINFWLNVRDVETTDDSLIYEFSTNEQNLLIFFNQNNGMLSLSASNGWSGNADLFIKVTDADGAFINTTIPVNVDPATDVNEDGNQLPVDYNLSQNYPNPFNPETKIGFSIPFGDNVKLEIYNVLGSITAVLIDQYLPAGNYSIVFTGTELSSGVYYYKLSSGNFIQMKKAVLVK